MSGKTIDEFVASTAQDDSARGKFELENPYLLEVMRVTPGHAVFADPNATVAWSGSLSPEITTDISFRTMMGRGSGESIQLKFEGTGWVVLQPYEEKGAAPQQGS